jgi:hypothetical protein
MFNRVQSTKSKPSEKVTNIRPAKPTPAGRDRLVFFDTNIGLAEKAIADLESRIETLESIVVDSSAAAKALQACVESDNGRSLSDYAAGKVDADSNIAKLVMLADNSKRAADAARSALPNAREQIENARAQLVGLTEQRLAELKRVLMNIGDVKAREYVAAFELLGRIHDELVGVASVLEDNLGDIRLIDDPVKTPRFAFPSMGNADADPFLRHRVSDLTSSESAKAWAAVKDRLEVDALADVSDLI